MIEKITLLNYNKLASKINLKRSIVHSKTSSLNHSKVLNKENPKNTKSVLVDNISNFNKSYNSNNKTLIGHK